MEATAPQLKAVVPPELGKRDLPPELEREVKQRRFMLQAKRVLVILVATVLVFILPLPITAQGARTNIPDLGSKLSKTPILGPKLFSGPSFAKIDAAYLVGLVAFWLTLFFLSKCLALWLAPNTSRDTFNDSTNLVYVVGGILALIADASLLYLGLCDRMWGKTSFSFVALLFTTMYVLGILAISLILMNIRTSIQQLEDL